MFKEREGEKRNWPLALAKTYATYAVTGLFLQSLLLFLFIDKLGCGKYLAQFLCVAINTPINFLLNKFWAFKAAKKGACEEAAL